MRYKRYIGSIEYNHADNCWYGKIILHRGIYIKHLITYEADSYDNIKNEFKRAVKDYIKFKRETNLWN